MQVFLQTAHAVLKWQLRLGCLAAVIFALQGVPEGLASVAGSIVAIVPTAVMYWRIRLALGQVGGQDPRRLVRMVYRAQATKHGLTLLLFAGVMAGWPAYFLQIMAGFVVCLAAYWFVMGREHIRD